MSNGKKINTSDIPGATRKSIADTAVEALKEGRLGRMSYLHVKSGFKLSTLALAVSLSLVSPHLFALESLDDASLASSTGEGIAFLPENFSMIMQAPNNTNPNAAYLANRANDTGYIRIIPVGPLTTEATNSGAGKADVFLYGLGLSESDKDIATARTAADLNTRFGSTANPQGNPIDSWGTGANPFVIKVFTENGVPTFKADTPTNTETGSVSYLSAEAPLYNKTITNGMAGIGAYNLKMGLWTDIFVRDPKIIEDMAATGTQFDLNGAGRANRLRLQAVWDGFSINGTNLKIFQTLGGATNTGGMSTTYNNTLGLAALVRLNSNANGVLRLSTQETTDTALLATPAINGGAAPTFGESEGITINNLNVNLVLGSLYQPLVLGTDGRNITLELTRIPNKASIYNKIYTDYSATVAAPSATYLGSTCSQFYCGNAVTGSSTSVAAEITALNNLYQGNNATHSSITMGTVNYNAANRTITADSTATAKGVTFTSPTGTATNLGSVAIDGLLIQHLKFTTKGL